MSTGLRRAFEHRDLSSKALLSSRPRIDPRSWGGALVIMLGVLAVLWVVQIVNAANDYAFDRFGLGPRRLGGLWGIVTEPFLHASYAHLLSNTLPVLAIGWVLLLSGARIWAIVSGFVVVVGGFATWLVGPSNSVIVGASGVVFGWVGYLLARAVFTRRLKWIVIALLVVMFFGSLLYGVLPTLHSRISWQAHLCGFLAGVLVAALLHLRRGERRLARPAVVR